MILSIKTQKGSYPILVERGALSRAKELMDLSRRCMIVTDDQIPTSYIETLRSQCAKSSLFVIPAGEKSKSMASFEACLGKMLDEGFTRSDCVVALGGGVVGDLAGFIAASFQRGVDFYNIPTTVLSQVDSSIGGKVAINFRGLKNMVGAFYPPKAVLIDPETLSTLPERQIANGLAESVKMALCFDAKLFERIEQSSPMDKIDEIIVQSLRIKARVVEEDEREEGLRKVLNFGHTLAHAIESESHRTGNILYHGESVALGMLPMSAPPVRERLKKVLEKLSLPTVWQGQPEELLEAMGHDKKMSGNSITVIRVDTVGSFRMEKLPFSQFQEEVKGLRL